MFKKRKSKETDRLMVSCTDLYKEFQVARTILRKNRVRGLALPDYIFYHNQNSVALA